MELQAFMHTYPSARTRDCKVESVAGSCCLLRRKVSKRGFYFLWTRHDMERMLGFNLQTIKIKPWESDCSFQISHKYSEAAPPQPSWTGISRQSVMVSFVVLGEQLRRTNPAKRSVSGSRTLRLTACCVMQVVP